MLYLSVFDPEYQHASTIVVIQSTGKAAHLMGSRCLLDRNPKIRREKLAQDVRIFLTAGGAIQVIGRGVSGRIQQRGRLSRSEFLARRKILDGYGRMNTLFRKGVARRMHLQAERGART